MAVETITPAQVHKHARQWEHTALTTELLLACGVVVLSILGIAGVLPTSLAGIAVIGLGAILLFQGATVVLHYGELLYEAGGESKAGAAEVSRGLTTEFLPGMTGIVLGVLALIGIVPTTLLSVAVITYDALARQHKTLRPEGPECEGAQTALPPKPSTSCLKCRVVQIVRFAQKNSFLLQDVNKLTHAGMSNGQIFRCQATLPFHPLNPDCDPPPQ